MEELKKCLIDLGYGKKDADDIINSDCLEGYKFETLSSKIKEIYNFFVSLGYSQEEVIKMTKTRPSIYSHSIENIRQKIEDMKALGYSQEEVIKMTKTLPSIYSLSIDTIKQKIEDMEALGYSRKEVIEMTKTLPSIYGFSIDSIKTKVQFYRFIGIPSIIVNDTMQLMQSTKLSYARYMFYKEKGINITENNYQKLFIKQKDFEKKYGLTKQELLARYKDDYEKYLEMQREQEDDRQEGKQEKRTRTSEEIDQATADVALVDIEVLDETYE